MLVARPARRTVLALALSAAGLALAAPAARGQAAVPAAGATGTTGGRVAVVNINVVQSKIQETAEFRAHMQNMQQLLDANRKGHAAQIDDHRNRLRNVKQDSDKFNELLVDLDEENAKFNFEDQLKQVALQREVNLKKKQLFDEIIAVTTDLAKKKGIDLVMVDNEVPLSGGVQDLTQEQLNNLLAQKTLLYVSPKIDLTDEVCVALDNQHRAAATGGPAVPPAK